MAYKIGSFFGYLINLGFYVFFAYDAYLNVKDGKSAILDVTALILLLFAKETIKRLSALYEASEFIAIKLYEGSQNNNNSVDSVFNNLTKDL
jgi:hypothetical protein